MKASFILEKVQLKSLLRDLTLNSNIKIIWNVFHILFFWNTSSVAWKAYSIKAFNKQSLKILPLYYLKKFPHTHALTILIGKKQDRQKKM